MKAYNLRVPSETVDFLTAVRRGLGEMQGLYMPSEVGRVPRNVLELPRPERSVRCSLPC
jgi:threonine synthase